MLDYNLLLNELDVISLKTPPKKFRAQIFFFPSVYLKFSVFPFDETDITGSLQAKFRV